MVSCKDRYQSAAHHIAPAFLDPPISTGPRLAEDSDPQYSHLNGTAPLLDLEGFMEDDLDEVAFVVIRTVECSPTAVMMVRAGIPLRWTEQIYTKSKALKSLLHEIASCYFQPVPDTNPKSIYPGYPYNQPNSPNSKFDHQQISPPDLFLFHHRSLLLDYPLKHPEYKVHADSLLQYMEAHHGTDFVEADQLFARGEVSQAHILKLFKPNDLVVSGTCGRPAAFVIQEWPKSDSSGWVTLVCWSFQTEGPGFTRKRSVLSIPPIETEVVRINTLPAYPLQFSTPEVKEYIQRNGKLQWELRIATQITYRGRNVKGDQSFVS